MTTINQEQEKEKQSPKVGVYICHCGGNISDHLDVEVLRQRMEKIPGVTVARTNMFMCSDPGQALIAEDLKKGLVGRVVVASCAPSLHELTFRQTLLRAGWNPYLYEQANIREQVSWVHHGQAATDKATRVVAAAVGKAKTLKPLEPLRVKANQQATVIGGGIAGLKVAKDLADRGFQVVLLERSPFLGGRTARLDRVAPTGEKASVLIYSLIQAVLRDPSIRVLTCAQVVGFEGYVGNFKLKIHVAPLESSEDQGNITGLKPFQCSSDEWLPFIGICPQKIPETPKEISLETGVIILATGFKPYAPYKGEYGFEQCPEVMTLPDFIQKVADNQSSERILELDGRKIRSLAMIHCVGSRQIPGIHEPNVSGYLNEYCSRTCCTAILQAASRIRENYPDTSVYEFYRDIRTYARGQEELYTRASQMGVVFLRFEAAEPPVVTKGNNYSNWKGFCPLKVKVKDTLTFGEEVEVPVDLVVLGVGMEPNPVPELVELMKVPVGADRFLLEVHPKLRPVELSIAGIFLAGTCQAPMDIGEVCNTAGAAAVKATAILNQGYVELDPFVAEVDLEKCKGHGACVKACLNPGALQMVEMEWNGQKVQRAQVLPALCKGCGACVAVCPERAINLQGWTLKQYEDMVDMIVSDKLIS